ncbi:MAG: LacI family DNA-binding transcriptional regulator [Cyclobacteriaceae bacterium]|nr:LacI family DNA-binding transcriptional regulator [Cyclobacteriaceae bacterium SS2]
MESKKVSIKDIASKSGVSIGTVDRVIHQRGEVSEKTRKKVLNVIEKLNYQPNLIARSLASKKKLRLAILLPNANSDNEYWYFPQVGIKKALNEIHDHGPVVHQLSFDQGNRKQFLDQLEKLESLEYDGLLSAAIFPDELGEFIDCHRKSKSIILVDTNIPGSGIDFVGQDAIKSGHVAGRLIELLTATYDKSKILIPKLVSNPQSMPILLKRIEGFKQYFKSVENPPVINEVTITIRSHQKSIPELQEILSQGYQAVFVPNSRSYLVSENIPTKINMIGYDLIDQNVKLLSEGGIDFVISQQPERQGYMAVMRLFNKLIGKTNSTMQYHLPIDILMKENVENYINKQMEFKSDIGY